ncbi:UNVERIFIED_CONTAM: hypothetical protein FKN15_067040 [Acipenser sinensis]
MLRIGADKRHGVPEKFHRQVAGKLQSDALQHTHGSLEYAPANWNYPSQAVKQAQT